MVVYVTGTTLEGRTTCHPIPPIAVTLGGGLFPPANLEGLQPTGFPFELGSFGIVGNVICVPEPGGLALVALGAALIRMQRFWQRSV
jgi:hypothetical protein